MKIIVLGGHGFVGKHVMELLKDTGHESKALSRRDGLDMINIESVREHLRKEMPDVIINCSAHVGSLHYVTEFAADVLNDNVQMTLNLYKAVKEICPKVKIVNPLSNCSYPGDADNQKENEYWNGPVHKSVWSYGNSRRTIAIISECYSMQYKIKSVNFIIANSYGPGDYIDPNKTHALNGMIIRMMKAKRAGEKDFEIWGTGKPQREWVYVKDVAKMLVHAALNIDEQTQPINLAQNKVYAIAETGQMIKNALKFEGTLKFNTKMQDGAMIKKLDDTLFRNKFPEFKFTDLDQGIADTVKYYEKVL